MARVTTWLFIESASHTADELSKQIGVRFDASRDIGDPLPGRPGLKSKSSLWRIDNRVEIPEDSEKIHKSILDGLRDLLKRIKGHEEGFVAAANLGEAGVLVGILAESVPPIIIEASIIKEIALLNVDLQFDLCVEEPTKSHGNWGVKQ